MATLFANLKDKCSGRFNFKFSNSAFKVTLLEKIDLALKFNKVY